MADSFNSKDQYPTPLLHLTFILQQLADELLLGQAGVGLSSVRIMSTLHSSVPHSQQHIARVLHQTEANVSRQLRQMKSQGLVSIAKNKRDGRKKDVLLTRKGSEKYKRAEKLLTGQQKHFFKMLDTKDQKALEHNTNRLLKTL